jgi:hypothetical protein
MNYAEYGLDTVKKSEDEGRKGYYTCPFCGNDKIEKGFSLCFAHFCICKSCIYKADTLTGQWLPDDGNGCFKCGKQNKGKVYDSMFYDPHGGVSICKDCIQWAKEIFPRHVWEWAELEFPNIAEVLAGTREHKIIEKKYSNKLLVKAEQTVYSIIQKEAPDKEEWQDLYFIYQRLLNMHHAIRVRNLSTPLPIKPKK